jgi:hypothetical protein
MYSLQIKWDSKKKKHKNDNVSGEQNAAGV